MASDGIDRGESQPATPTASIRQTNLRRRNIVAALIAGAGVVALNLYFKSSRPGVWTIPPVEVVIGGPFDPKSYLPITTPVNDFVEPRATLVRPYPDGEVLVKVEFVFKGEIAKGNTIELTVIACDAAGEKISSKTVLCHDKRASPIPPAKLGLITLISDTANRPNVVVPLSSKTAVATVRLRFARV